MLRELPPDMDASQQEVMRAKARRNGTEGPFAGRTDEWLANQLRMLDRNDLYHEAFCVAARDRIMALSLRVTDLEAAITACNLSLKSYEAKRSQASRKLAPSSPLPGHACTDAELKALEPLYDQAVDFAKSETTMSVSKMQRKFSIGYNRAARLCERLADEGILIYEKSAYHWRGSASTGRAEHE